MLTVWHCTLVCCGGLSWPGCVACVCIACSSAECGGERIVHTLPVWVAGPRAHPACLEHAGDDFAVGLTTAQTCKTLDVNPSTGLSVEEVESRLAEHGQNGQLSPHTVLVIHQSSFMSLNAIALHGCTRWRTPHSTRLGGCV